MERSCNTGGPFIADYSSILSSLNCDQMWTSALTTILYSKKLLQCLIITMLICTQRDTYFDLSFRVLYIHPNIRSRFIPGVCKFPKLCSWWGFQNQSLPKEIASFQTCMLDWNSWKCSIKKLTGNFSDTHFLCSLCLGKISTPMLPPHF